MKVYRETLPDWSLLYTTFFLREIRILPKISEKINGEESALAFLANSMIQPKTQKLYCPIYSTPEALPDILTFIEKFSSLRQPTGFHLKNFKGINIF